ncbi:hypothetical protein [Methanobrevibacter sp.]|uniref:hypothetical protein n=1 Tax=Methanobrevibacter sp. TaxID=66852 RepID=UPI0026E081D8|nr:hypothetical protein [Methanobrevibacter sp.]MDO5860566.1 hypothetical protein [Methanobrevibacter sp.]
MDKKELIIVGIIIIIAVVVGSILFASNGDSKYTTLDVLNKGAIGENSTVYVKLSDNEKTALSGKTLHIKLTNNESKVIYENSVKTHATGVAIVELENISAGDYNLNVTFDGDENYTGSSISQKITVKEGYVEENLENSTLIEDTIADAQNSDTSSSQSSSSYSTSYSSQSSSNSQSSSQSDSSSSQESSDSSSDAGDDSSDSYYDENGKEVLPEYDENGKVVT